MDAGSLVKDACSLVGECSAGTVSTCYSGYTALTLENALLDQLVGRGTACEVVAQAVLHTSAGPRSDVGAVRNVSSGARRPKEPRREWVEG